MPSKKPVPRLPNPPVAAVTVEYARQLVEALNRYINQVDREPLVAPVLEDLPTWPGARPTGTVWITSDGILKAVQANDIFIPQVDAPAIAKGVTVVIG